MRLTPKITRFCATVNNADALRIAAPLIQPKAVAFLRQHAACAEVAACAAGYETIVHAGATQFGGLRTGERSRVLLLGLGTVGFGVYRRLLANREHFEVIGALVRGRAKYEAQRVPPTLLYTDLDRVARLKPDIVVDALPGREPSAWLVEHFLSAGPAVLSANQALIAEAGVSLAALAGRRGSTLRYSAAVGGAAPMIEAIDPFAAQGPIASIAAVLNGTCNFVLEACAHGATHLIGNIPHFVSLFLEDKYNNPTGKYFDRCTPPAEAVQFHNALLENGVKSVLVTYPEEGHGIRKYPAAIDYAARVVAWFEEHLGPGK